ncbi:MAG TPA: peptidase E [Dehalococcoidia bacterium]|nr:peptidase E [Dehalococcoidia bacterium]
MEPTIVSIGGGGLGGTRDDGLLDDYLLALTGKESPRVCLIPTASGDNDAIAVWFYNSFTSDRCRPSHLALFNRKVEDIRSFLLAQDLIWVSGGNTAAMLAIWRQHGVDAVLREAWQEGVVLSGSSAGANCWFEACSTDSFGPSLAPLNDGLGFLAGSFCPHYDGEVNRRPTLERFLTSGSLQDGYAVDNYVGIRWTGTALTEVIAAKQGSKAYRVGRSEDGKFKEQSLAVRLLG